MNWLIFGGIISVLIAASHTKEACRNEMPSWKCQLLKRTCFKEDVRDFMEEFCHLTCGYCTGPTLAPGQTIPPHVGGCGRSDIQGSRVVGGKTAVRGSWPWQILLMIGGYPMCGGTLIDPLWVVTAAHCVYGKEDSGLFSIRVGEHDRQAKEISEADIKVEKVIRHPKYSTRNTDNDITLLKLSQPVQFNKYVSPVCLPSKEVEPGTNCYVTGWGKTKHPGSMAEVLQQGMMSVVSNKVCDEKNKHRLRKTVTDGMICAGSGGTDRLAACHGDSGGPLVCQVNGIWELHGSVSYGSPVCISSETYTVFSRTFHYLPWIKSEMEKMK